MNPLVTRQYLVGANTMLARLVLKKGAHVPEHHHFHEQISHVVQGALEFRVDGKKYGSENDALLWTAANPLDREHMVVVAAGNSPLSTVLASRERLGQFQFEVLKSGEPVESGFDKP